MKDFFNFKVKSYLLIVYFMCRLLFKNAYIVEMKYYITKLAIDSLRGTFSNRFCLRNQKVSLKYPTNIDRIQIKDWSNNKI